MRFTFSLLAMASLVASAASAQTEQTLQAPAPYQATQAARGPVAVPLAPVLDPNFEQQQQAKARVDYITIPAAPPAGWELVDVLKDQPMADNFRQAVERVGLDRPIDINQGVTAFIPVVTGRNSSDPVSMNGLQNATKEQLSHYIVNDRINIALIHGTGDNYRSVDGSKLRITKMGNSVSVNGQRVVDAVKTPQGFIYYINGMFEGPAQAQAQPAN